MAEDKIKAWIPRFRTELCLDEKFQEAYENVLRIDRKNMDLKSTAYPAGIAYIACLFSNESRTQKQIADVTKCSVSQLQRSYRSIKRRNNLEYDGS